MNYLRGQIKNNAEASPSKGKYAAPRPPPPPAERHAQKSSTCALLLQLCGTRCDTTTQQTTAIINHAVEELLELSPTRNQRRATGLFSHLITRCDQKLDVLHLRLGQNPTNMLISFHAVRRIKCFRNQNTLLIPMGKSAYSSRKNICLLLEYQRIMEFHSVKLSTCGSLCTHASPLSPDYQVWNTFGPL